MTEAPSRPLRGLARFRGPTSAGAAFAVGLSLLLTLAAGGIAAARIPGSSDGKFHACMKADGSLRMIDHQAGARCVTGETRIAWSSGYRYRGVWGSRTAYAVNDVALLGGSSYVARAASTNVTPGTSTTTWGLLARAGAPGARGPAGPPGQDGNTVLHGTGAPTTVGTVGDFYLDTATQTMYGPKDGTGWGAGARLGGEPGAQARVSSSGSSNSHFARNVGGAQRLGTGAYCVEVHSAVDLTKRVVAVTVEGTAAAVGVQVGICGANTVHVRIADHAGTAIDRGFYLSVP